jgi:signal transduction histidine kinase/CheY-like chemotaxis protein/HPt (histidine-containing phosphotransfer) domain-containing protein
MFDSAPLAITYWLIEEKDAAGHATKVRMMDCNQHAVELFGLGSKEECMSRYSELNPEYQRGGEKSTDAALRVLSHLREDGTFEYDWLHRTLSGEEIPCRKTQIRVSRQGKDIIINYAQDLRWVRDTMVKLREADQRTSTLLDAMPVCANLCDSSLKAVECNQAAARLFDLPDKQTYLDSFYKLSPEYQPDGSPSYEKAREMLRKAFDEGSCNFNWIHQKLTGELIPCEISLIRVVHRGEAMVAGYTRDMRGFEALQRVALAEESNKIKSRFLATMSHEIRTPMNAIMGITEIQLHNESLPAETRDALSRIYSSSNLLLNIVNDILDLSKIEAGKLQLMLNPYQTASLINDSVQMNASQFQSKPIDFVLNVDERIPAVLNGDELRIKQIINNILSNAFKYTDMGTVVFTVGYEADRDNPDAVHLLFEIRDTGQGMTPEQLEKLFDEFERFNLEANRLTVGVGLGMNITYKLVKMMGGQISVESVPGEGSVFYVRLPQRSGSQNIIGKEIKDNLENFRFNESLSYYRTSQIVREPMPYGRVLIVDDMESNLYVAKGLLTPYYIQVDTAQSGYEAISKIQSGKVYDIIFMDHMMPRMNGIEATNIIRANGYTQPIVALTANAVVGQAEIFIENGFEEFISKPIDTRQLNQVLNRFIRDKQPKEVIRQARSKRSKAEVFEPASYSAAFVQSFLRDAEKTKRVLEDVYLRRDNCTPQDIQNYIIHVHAVKSALINVGETALSKYAARLEEWGRAGNFVGVFAETPGFLSMLRSCMEKFGLESVTGEEESNPTFSEDMLGKWIALRDACLAYEKKTAKQIIEELNEPAKAAGLTEVLRGISVHLLHSAFEEAGEAALDVINKYNRDCGA